MKQYNDDLARRMESGLRRIHNKGWNRWLRETEQQTNGQSGSELYENPRKELEDRQPKMVQPLITFVTGKAGSEKPLWKNTTTSAYLMNLSIMAGSTLLTGGLLLCSAGASFAGQVAAAYPLLLGMLITAGTVRYGNSVAVHHSTHYNFVEPEWWNDCLASPFLRRLPEEVRERFEGLKGWNRLLGEIQSTIALTTPFDLYKEPHEQHHKYDILATWADPDWKFLHSIGFVPGKPKSWYWKSLWKTLVSPRFHACFLRDRLRANFTDKATPLYRRRMAWTFLALLVSLVGVGTAFGGIGVLLAFLLAYALPVLLLANCNGLLQLISEHQWLRVNDSDSKKVILDRKTHARYLIPALPSKHLPVSFKLLAWMGWWLRLLLWELPVCRLYILPGDLPQHPRHHRKPGSVDWPNTAYVMRDEIAAGSTGWTEPYRENYSFRAMLNEVFALLSSLPPLDGPPTPPTPEEESEIFRQM